MAILRKMVLAQARSLSGKARLECGCLAGRYAFYSCPQHRRELAADLRALTEDDARCEEACCDPA